MKFILLFILLASTELYALDLSLGFFRFNDSVQDRKGEERSTPFEPSISIGHTFSFFREHQFSPVFGYIKRSVRSDDSYNKDYSKYSFFILYDFAWKPLRGLDQLTLRYGLGNFITVVKGDGGRVTVPNGAGTDTAYLPSESSKSYTGSINLGADWKIISTWGTRFETFIFSPLNKEQRSAALWLSFYKIF